MSTGGQKRCQEPITFLLGPLAGTKRHIQADQETVPDTFDKLWRDDFETRVLVARERTTDPFPTLAKG